MTQSPLAIIGMSKLFREGLQVLLRRSRFGVVSKVATLEEALPAFATRRPDLLIYALASPDDASARIEQLRSHQTQLDGIRIVLLTNQCSAENLRDAASVGVQGVLSQDITSDVLHRSLELAMLGQQFFPSPAEEAPARPAAALIPFSRPALASALTSVHDTPNAPGSIKSLFGHASAGTGPQRSTTLSERERQILQCLVEGAANKTIARDLQITEATVKVHIKGLLRKIRVANRTQAAVWGLSNNVFNDGSSTPSRDHARDFQPARQAAS